MPDTWILDPADAESIPISRLVGNQPSPLLGDTGSWSFEFVPDAEEYGDHVERYERLVSYQGYAGAYATGVDGQRRPWYREQHPGSSLLVALRPPDWDTTGRGQWALIDSIDDSAEVPEKIAPVDLDLLYLAPLSKYDSARAARAMEANGT